MHSWGNFGKFLANISSNILSDISLSFPSGTPITHMFVYLIACHGTLALFFFSCSSDWVTSIELPLSSLTLSSACLSFLLHTSKFFVLIKTFQPFCFQLQNFCLFCFVISIFVWVLLTHSFIVCLQIVQIFCVLLTHSYTVLLTPFSSFFRVSFRSPSRVKTIDFKSLSSKSRVWDGFVNLSSFPVNGPRLPAFLHAP